MLGVQNFAEDHLWSCTLDGTNKEYEWTPADPADSSADSDAEDDDPNVKPVHRLTIKNVVLHPEAKSGELTVVQVESVGFQESKMKFPICALREGGNMQQVLDLKLPQPAKLTLSHGSGPVSLVGIHSVDFGEYRYMGQESDSDADEEAEEDAESSADDQEDEEQEVTSPKAKKIDTKKKGKKTPVKDAKDKEGEEKEGAKEKAESAEKPGKKTPGSNGKKGGGKVDEATTPTGGKKRKASGEQAEAMEEDGESTTASGGSGKKKDGKKKKRTSGAGEGK